ncbi:MAG: hypothetical protein HY042_03160 [Spirochaetia bacterium]|nr:hypothetical protein [Spirochaetia bacterium]
MNTRLLLVLSTTFVSILSCSSVPDGVEGEAAERRLDELRAAHNIAAWEESTAAVSFTFRGKHRIFWDKRRRLVEVTWGDGDDARFAQFTQDFSRSIVRVAGKEVTSGPVFEESLKKANALFVNDTYWLAPLSHARSPGARRFLLPDGSLRVTFTSGGVTPGDSYVFHVGPDGLVSSMNMWVSVFKWNPGMKASFIKYITTETGVKVSVDNVVFGFSHVGIGDLKMFAQYPVAGEPDRFVLLVGPLARP